MLMQKAWDGTRPCAAKKVVFDREREQSLAGQGARGKGQGCSSSPGASVLDNEGDNAA